MTEQAGSVSRGTTATEHLRAARTLNLTCIPKTNALIKQLH